MDRIGANNWNRFKNLMNKDVTQTFQQEDIIWVRSSGGLDVFSEDNEDEIFTEITLKGQFLYNYFRTWPLDNNSGSGKFDGQNQTIIFNLDYLKELNSNYLLPDNRMNYNPASDRFKHNGYIYSCQGDTFIVQAQDKTLFMFIILQREETNTGDTRSTETV